jgi:hypothetical protein
MAKKKKYLEVNCSSSMPEVVIVSTPGVQFEKKTTFDRQIILSRQWRPEATRAADSR